MMQITDKYRTCNAFIVILEYTTHVSNWKRRIFLGSFYKDM